MADVMYSLYIFGAKGYIYIFTNFIQLILDISTISFFFYR